MNVGLRPKTKASLSGGQQDTKPVDPTNAVAGFAKLPLDRRIMVSLYTAPNRLHYQEVRRIADPTPKEDFAAVVNDLVSRAIVARTLTHKSEARFESWLQLTPGGRVATSLFLEVGETGA